MFELNDYIYQELREYLTENSQYKDNLLVLPNIIGLGEIRDDEVVVVVNFNDLRNQDVSLNHTEHFDRQVFTLEVFSRKVGTTNGERVVRVVADEILDFVRHNLRLKVDKSSRTPNIDMKVYRYQFIISCLYDVENKKIYLNY